MIHRGSRILLVAALPLLLTAAPPALADAIGWYFPLAPGASWTYVNPFNAADTYTASVFATIQFAGHPAYRFGESMSDHMIAYREGGQVMVYARVEDGELGDLVPDIVLGAFADADRFAICSDGHCDTTLIRVWQNIDPGWHSYYGLDPAWTDLIALAAMDADQPPNLHNTVLGSNLPVGATMPAGAVTSLEWYRRGVGMVAEWDIDAATGEPGERYVLLATAATGGGDERGSAISLRCAPNPFNPRTTIELAPAQEAIGDVAVLDARGRLVVELYRGVFVAGVNRFSWDGRDARGRPAASGAYWVRARAGTATSLEKVVLLR